uniref:Uncharacterized protein n=1 Tax=viral metagenome TaxID=1070528 RepID=A0A6M3J470_9ZZZZ
MSKPAPRSGHDKMICADCRNRGACFHPCAPLTWIDGNVPRRENFIHSKMLDYEQRDYKTVLYDLQCHHSPTDRIEQIGEIADIRIRAVCAMLAVDIPKANIADLLHISIRHLHHICHPAHKRASYRRKIREATK